jgi:hypothetical protein
MNHDPCPGWSPAIDRFTPGEKISGTGPFIFEGPICTAPCFIFPGPLIVWTGMCVCIVYCNPFIDWCIVLRRCHLGALPRRARACAHTHIPLPPLAPPPLPPLDPTRNAPEHSSPTSLGLSATVLVRDRKINGPCGGKHDSKYTSGNDTPPGTDKGLTP